MRPMARNRTTRITALSATLCSLPLGGLLLWWFAFDPTADLVLHVPGMDGEPLEGREVQRETEGVRIGEFFEIFDGYPSELQSRWPRFRGAHFDNISRETVRLRDFSDGAGPRVLWSVELGEGHAAPAVAHGRVYLLDYDEEVGADALRSFSLDDGTELWRRWYPVEVRRNHGMSRTIPAVTDSFVVTIGPRCHVMCVDPMSGELLWTLDMEREFGTETPLWYTGQCPLIDRDTVAILAPGGRALLAALHCRSGELLWETPNPRGWKMSHSSVMPMELGGRRVYVYVAQGGVVGVAADGPDRGTVLFETDEFNQSVVAASPVALEGDRIFVTSGYGGGSILLQVRNHNGVFSVETLKRMAVTEGLASEQQTPLYHQGHLFAVLPRDAGPLRNQLVCVRADNPAEVVWSSGPRRRFGLGPYLIADNKLFLLDDRAMLTVVGVSTERYVELGQVPMLEGGVDAWGPMALAAGRLLLRDATRMICVDVQQ